MHTGSPYPPRRVDSDNDECFTALDNSVEPERALVFLPGADAVAAGAACMEYAARAGYRIEGIVIGRWCDIVALLLGDSADVVVVADRSHLPCDRTPRVEVVEEQLLAPVPAVSGRPRRPRQLI